MHKWQLRYSFRILEVHYKKIVIICESSIQHLSYSSSVFVRFRDFCIVINWHSEWQTKTEDF